MLTKICGLTRLEDALLCAEAGADAIGINFFPKSKRFHPLEQAALWLDKVPSGLARTAVLVNAPAEDVLRIAESGLIDVLQFHGDETPEDMVKFRSLGRPVIKALPLRPDTTLESLRAWPVDALLLDAWAPGAYGGTGHTIDWTHAAEVIRALAPLPVILSGGLTPANIAEAVRRTRPAGVDTASGVEVSPGLKDHGKIRALTGECLRAAMA
ncbi:MAG: phosphoribosylanthranilate isomerase [Verrucomicrobiaceae bacterium]|nr:MAG: phosphoribosylanthranilate isomerase [Verrucomicrobiaceae bacterium]